MPDSADKGQLTWFLCCPFYGIGIVGALLLYGLWQERIMTYPYDGEYFTGSAFLVLCNRVIGALFGWVMAKGTGEDTLRTAPLWKYTLISVTAVAASVCQYEALRYVSFTVQILGKTCKMVPVMLWGTLLSGKSYIYLDWATSLLVTGGMVEFLLTGTFKSETDSGGTCLHGLLFLLAFVALDGFTSTFQEKLFSEHMTSKYNQMFHVNLASAAITVVAVLISGHTKETITFCGIHPSVIGDIVLLSLVAVVAQWFIFSQVQEYGALVFAATVNVRQIVSVLASYLAYKHPITGWQIVGLCIVGVALVTRSVIGFMVQGSDGSGRTIVEGMDRIRATRMKKNYFKRTAGCCPILWKL